MGNKYHPEEFQPTQANIVRDLDFSREITSLSSLLCSYARSIGESAMLRTMDIFSSTVSFYARCKYICKT